MPAPRPDMSTPHGRLQYARMCSPWDQDEFARKMGYESASGWAKIETGQNELKYEHIAKANEHLKLDVRYYFGEIAYEDAKPERIKRLEDLGESVKELQRIVRPVEALDEVTDTVRTSKSLHDLVQMIYTQPPAKLRELIALLYGYLHREAQIGPAVNELTRERDAANQ